jgi:rhodanese-related sulfurtransferase
MNKTKQIKEKKKMCHYIFFIYISVSQHTKNTNQKTIIRNFLIKKILLKKRNKKLKKSRISLLTLFKKICLLNKIKSLHISYIMYKKLLFIICCIVGTVIIYKKKHICCNMKNKPIEKKFLLINVLAQEEFLDAHIEQSTHVPVEEVSSFLDAIQDKNIPLIFYCANYLCTSSDDAALIAIKKGFKNVSVYQGGTAEWYQTSKTDPSFICNGPAKATYLEMVIFPKKEDDFLEEENISEKTKNIKKIEIKDLQKILKESTLK